jgi:hypothetical protein
MNKGDISFARLPKQLIEINKDLQGKCGPAYKIDILQYRFRPENAAVYDEEEYNIILCLYHHNVCVSSIAGKYEKSINAMQLTSKTDANYEGKKYNLYLRTIFMYLMCSVRPSIQKIYSNATNPISIYTMYKHYHAFNPDLQEYVSNHHLTPDTFTPEDAKKFHADFLEKHKLTPETAQEELDGMLDHYSLEELGLGATEEEAIENIINTLSITTVTLEINLEQPGIAEFLFNKFKQTQIICVESSLENLTGGKKKKNKKNKKKRTQKKKKSQKKKSRRRIK